MGLLKLLEHGENGCVCSTFFETLKLCWMFFLVDGAFGPRSLLLLFFKNKSFGEAFGIQFRQPGPKSWVASNR